MASSCREFCTYFGAFFITVATVLGTGIVRICFMKYCVSLVVMLSGMLCVQLGLPVDLANSGFFPFVTTFAVCLMMQLAVVWLMVDLLQRTHVQLIKTRLRDIVPSMDIFFARDVSSRTSNASAMDPDEMKSAAGSLMYGSTTVSQPAGKVPAVDECTSSVSSVMEQDAAKDKETTVENRVKSQFQEIVQEKDFGEKCVEKWTLRVADEFKDSVRPNLHSMGKMYLGKTGQRIFDAAVMLHFVSVLISYVLAGSKSYQGFLNGELKFEIIILLYCIAYTAIIVFGGKFIQPVISVITVLKCSLLILMIGIVGFVSTRIDLSPWNSWAHIMEPYLLGTVALGGVVNILPVVYSSLPLRKNAVKNFRIAVSAGVIVCWLLNVFWAFFVLKIVPQTTEDPDGTSLEHARENGDISTVPVRDIIDKDYPQYHWVSIVVNAFIILSVSVSYLTLGTGMKHVLDGVIEQRFLQLDVKAVEQLTDDDDSHEDIKEHSPKHFKGNYEEEHAEYERTLLRYSSSPSDPDGSSFVAAVLRPLRKLTRGALTACAGVVRRGVVSLNKVSLTIVLYLFWFGLILVVAISNPDGFFDVLEVFTSLALNIESGFFIGLMWYSAKKRNVAESNQTLEDEQHHEPTLPHPATLIQAPSLLSDKFGNVAMLFTIVTFLFAVIFDIGEALGGVIGTKRTVWVFLWVVLLSLNTILLPRTGKFWLFYYNLPVPYLFPKDLGFGDAAAVSLKRQPRKCFTLGTSVLWRIFAARFLREKLWPIFVVTLVFSALNVDNYPGNDPPFRGEHSLPIISALLGIFMQALGQITRTMFLLKTPTQQRESSRDDVYLNTKLRRNRRAIRISCIFSALCPLFLILSCIYYLKSYSWVSGVLVFLSVTPALFTALAHLAQRSVLIATLYKKQFEEELEDEKSDSFN